MAINSTTSRVSNSGKDSVLGRWSWMTLQGGNNILVTIITGYRPCDNSSGSDYLYLQQQRYLNVKQVESCPQELWLADVSQLVKGKLNDGHQIIVMAAMNDSVKQKLISTWADKTGLVEVVSQTTSKEIPTHQRGKKHSTEFSSAIHFNLFKQGTFLLVKYNQTTDCYGRISIMIIFLASLLQKGLLLQPEDFKVTYQKLEID